MIAKHYDADSPEKLRAVFGEIRALREYGEAKTVLAFFSCNLLEAHEAQRLMAAIGEGIPRAKILGLSNIALRDMGEKKSVNISVSFFRSSDAEIREYGPGEDLKNLGRVFRRSYPKGRR